MFAVHESDVIWDTVYFAKLYQVREPDINLSEEYMQILHKYSTAV